VRTNTSQPFQPLDTKEQNDDHWEKMYGPRAPGIKAFNDFYRKKK